MKTLKKITHLMKMILYKYKFILILIITIQFIIIFFLEKKVYHYTLLSLINKK